MRVRVCVCIVKARQVNCLAEDLNLLLALVPPSFLLQLLRLLLLDFRICRLCLLSANCSLVRQS